jgi:hypothetical protein
MLKISLLTRKRLLRVCWDAAYSRTKEISVRAIQPPALSDQRRKEPVEGLTKYFAEVDARRQPGSAEEAEEIFTEAIRSTRPGYRPHQ